MKLVRYIDSNMGEDIDDCQSTLGYVFSLSVPFSWLWKKQSIVALSMCEVENILPTTWVMNLLKDLGIPMARPLKIFVDNKSTINLAKNPIRR
jgi:hypothetical protein